MQQNIGNNQMEYGYGKLNLPTSTITTVGGNTNKHVIFTITTEMKLSKPLNYLNIDELFFILIFTSRDEKHKYLSIIVTLNNSSNSVDLFFFL